MKFQLTHHDVWRLRFSGLYHAVRRPSKINMHKGLGARASLDIWKVTNPTSGTKSHIFLINIPPSFVLFIIIILPEKYVI